jgi:hypothetical protein
MGSGLLPRSPEPFAKIEGNIMAETQEKGPKKAILDMGTPGGIMGTLIPADEDQREIPFVGMDGTGESASPAIYTFGGRHWQQGDRAPISIVALIEHRAREIYPEQFEGKRQTPVEDPNAVASPDAVNALTVATGNPGVSQQVAEATASGDSDTLGKVDAPAASQTVSEQTGDSTTAEPGMTGTGSLPVTEEEEEEQPASSGARRRRS